MLVFLVNLVYSMIIARVPADPNPWHSRGIEFQLPTPVPVTNFERTPVIQSGPYEYGVPDAPPVAALGPPAVVRGEGSR
jgi:cytochrome c oxidase subunit 1